MVLVRRRQPIAPALRALGAAVMRATVMSFAVFARVASSHVVLGLGVLGLVVLGLAAPAAAQDLDARARFERALVAIADGRYASAVSDLEASLALAPRPSTAFNLAIAQRGTGELLAAEATFDALLAGHYGALDDARVAQATALRDEVRAQIGSLSILVEGAPGPRVTVDGTEVHAGPDGRFEVRVSPGTRRVAVTALEHRLATRTVEVAPGARLALTVTLEPEADVRPGVLELDSETAGTVLVIEGVAEGPAPLRRELAPGLYRVRAGDGATSDVQLPPGRRVRLVLEPASHSLVSEPWLWIVIGVAVGAGVAVGIWAGTQAPTDVFRDPYWDSVSVRP